jgi:hypothetical protein
MPLDFSQSEPWALDGCVYIMGRHDGGEVLCKIPFETLWTIGKGMSDPVVIYLANRTRIEGLFSNLWDHGHFDEHGNIQFSTGIHKCPKVLV